MFPTVSLQLPAVSSFRAIQKPRRRQTAEIKETTRSAASPRACIWVTNQPANCCLTVGEADCSTSRLFWVALGRVTANTTLSAGMLVPLLVLLLLLCRSLRPYCCVVLWAVDDGSLVAVVLSKEISCTEPVPMMIQNTCTHRKASEAPLTVSSSCYSHL